MEALEKPKSERGKVQTDVFMETDGGICKVKLKSALEALGGDYQNAVMRNKNNEESMEAFQRQNSMVKERAQKIKIEDLIVIRKLGEGQFGQVYLVKDPNYQIPFAVKTISKSQIASENLVQYVLVGFLNKLHDD